MKKYSIYAIGEVALVMIGILLALQVNNWNEQKNKTKLEHELLAEIKGNFQADLKDIRFNMKYDSTNDVATRIVLNHLENRTPFYDSLKFAYGKLGLNTIFMENTSAYDNLKSLGFNLISNKELRNRITTLYSARYKQINKLAELYSDFIFTTFQPSMIKQTSSSTDKTHIRHPNQVEELYNNLPFQELLRTDLFFKNFSTQRNKEAEKEILELIELIDKEIGS